MYSLKNVLDKSPIQLSGVIVLGLNLLVVLGVIHLSGLQVAGSNGFLIALLGLFVSNKTANKAVLEELKQ